MPKMTSCSAPGETAAHLCVDMQRMFAEGTDWKMPWLEHVPPNILSITSTHPEKTIFTRFIRAPNPARASACGVTILYGDHHRRRNGRMRAGDHAGRDRLGFRVILVTDAICSSADARARGVS
jgi:nicotinamidase-related amidase